MFTLFGNDAAIRHSRTSTTPDYPAGSVIALALWHQREHPRWFGGKVPAQPVSVEFVEIQALANGQPSILYREYEGAPLTGTSTVRSQVERRAEYILSLRASVMP